MRVAEHLERRPEIHEAEVLERGEGHYEVQEVSFGKVYRWCPEHVVVECECGEKPVLTRSATTCGCGSDHSRFFEEGTSTGRLASEALRPWRSERDREDAGLPC